MTNQIPQGFIYDEKTGLYYTQRIESDGAGRTFSHVTWFNPGTGEYTENYYDAPVNQGQPMYNNQPQNVNINPNAKKKSSAGIVVLLLVVAIIIAAVVWIIISSSDSDEGNIKDDSETTEISSDTTDSAYSSVQVDSMDFIKTSRKSPMNCKVSDFNITLQSPNDSGFGGMRVVGTGDMLGEFLTNPGGYKTGDSVYCWDFFFTDKVGIRVYGLADCTNLKEPTYVYGKDYLKAAIISKNGAIITIQEEIPFFAESDGFHVGEFNLQKYDASFDPYTCANVEINVTMGSSGQSGDIFVSNQSPDETVTEEEIMGSGVDLHTSGMPGFKHCGGFDCTDSSLPADALPRIILEDDGYCELYANLGDGYYKFQGYYEYDELDGETYITMYFPGNSGSLSKAELLYDGEVENGYIYFLTDGFGLMGGDEYFAGYFYRVY